MLLVQGRCVNVDDRIPLGIGGWPRRKLNWDFLKLQVVPGEPAMQSIPRSLPVRIGHQSFNEFATCFFHFAFSHQGITPIAISNFLVGIDAYGSGEPLTCLVHLFLVEISIANIHGRQVELAAAGGDSRADCDYRDFLDVRNAELSEARGRIARRFRICSSPRLAICRLPWTCPRSWI